MGSKIGSISVIAGKQVSGQMWDRHDTAVLCFICCRCMNVLFAGDPWIPWAAIHQCIPGIITGMVGLWAFLPARRYCALDRRIGFLNIVGQLCIHVIGACRLRIESKNVMEFSKHIINDRLLVFHGKHPDAEILSLIFLPEFLTRQSKQGKCDLISIPFMVFLCDSDRFFIK